MLFVTGTCNCTWTCILYLLYDCRKAVASNLHPGAKYRQVALVRLVGMLLIVHVRNEMYSFVKNIAIDTVGTGIMGKMVSVLCCM